MIASLCECCRKPRPTGHELYNIGHMLQGAIAYYRATGDRKLLDAGIRFVDDFLIPNYGPAPKKPIVSGHPEIEMALIELYRITGDKRQLDLAGYILQGDDADRPAGAPNHLHVQRNSVHCDEPSLKDTRCEPCTPVAAPPTITWRPAMPAYWKTLNTLWNDMTTTKMYVTGGVGSRSDGEAFGDAYELPNFRAYGESCAAIGNMMWNWRMLAATGDAKFTDVIERALYNGINSGMSLDGTLYCYRNPLAFDPSTGEKIRNPVVRHDLLPAEPGAHLRVASGIFLQHQQRRNLRAPVRQFGTELASGERRRPEGHAEDELSMGRHVEIDGHARRAVELFLSANSRVGRSRASDRQWQSD